ncbi:hypothetical protein [Arthrobacter sp. NPDC092385]|uniref:hypothetical protein n=1 Tax=Arthrobacter sp. NPDC092385 TaxID=3363943 RepID=UPI0038302053
MGGLIQYGVFVGGLWALSLLGLKAIRDADGVGKATKEAATVAILATNFVSSMAAAFVLGVAALQTAGGGLLAVALFLVPFIAMLVSYLRAKSKKGWAAVVFFGSIVATIGLCVVTNMVDALNTNLTLGEATNTVLTPGSTKVEPGPTPTQSNG